MHDLLIALAGGAIGAVLAGLGWATLRVAAIPGDLDRHDFQVRVLNETVELWVSDSYRELKQQLRGITNEKAAKGQLYSGVHGTARAHAKSQFLHCWRDRRYEAEMELAKVQSEETWLHGLWRRISPKRAKLELSAPDQVESIIEEVRRPVTRHGGTPVEVHDPTRFKLEELQEEVRSQPLEPTVPPRISGTNKYGQTLIENEPGDEIP